MSQVLPISPPPQYSARPNVQTFHNSDPFYNKHFPKTAVIILSFIQLFFSLLLIISEIIGMKYPFDIDGFPLIYGSPGMFNAIIFGASGSFGIWAGYYSSRCTIVAHMVFAIISTLTCIPLISYATFASIIGQNKSAKEIAESKLYRKRVNSLYGSRFSTGYENLEKSTESNFTFKITFGIFICHIMIGLIQAIIAIASSAMTCGTICCRDKPTTLINAGSTSLTTKQLVMSTKPVLFISTLQILASIVSIILNCIGIAFPNDEKIAYFGTGIWTAIPFLITGSLGVFCGHKPSKCLVINFMTFSIISMFFCLPYFGVSVVGMASSANYEGVAPPNPKSVARDLLQEHGYANIGYRYLEQLEGMKDENYVRMKQRYDNWKNRKVTYGVFLLHTLISLLQIMILINSSAMAFQAICCPTNGIPIHTQTHHETLQISHLQVKSTEGRNQTPPVSTTPSFQPPIQLHAAEFHPRKMPISSISNNQPFTYKPPQDLVYLSSTHAEIGRGMKIQSTANCPDIF